MSFFGKWSSALLAAAFFVAASGCSPLDQGPQDEEKEPHFVLGKSRVNAMDYPGAIEAFEESLEANPHSAQAHYQLAMLYENQQYQQSDPAAAIYHYQQYLKYDPKAENADVIAGHITSCKQQLAADVLPLPSAPAAQQQLEKLTEENRRLHDQLAQWQAYFAAQQAAAKTNPPAAQNNFATPTQVTSPTPEDVTPATISTATPTATAAHKPAPPKISKPRTHTVVSGDTLAGIARKQGISLAALEAANPGVNPKKLKAGQMLNLPASGPP
jgi:LysM repeat protein